jgi:hypothetical protein
MRILLGVAAFLASLVAGGWLGMPSAAAAPTCADLSGVVESEQMCHIHTAKPGYTLDLRYPVDYPDQQALTDYVVQNRDGFISVAQMPGPHDVPYVMDGTAERHRSGGTHTAVLKIFQDVGGPHSSTWYKTFNYNLNPRRAITFDTLFAPGSKPVDAIFPIVQRNLASQTGMPVELIPPGSGLDPSHYQNFAITDDEVIFYFAPGELLPMSSGATSVPVPRNAIPPLAL